MSKKPSIFQYDGYRPYILARKAALLKKGWGFVNRLASHLGVSQVLVSQVLGGRREFSLEQAVRVCDFLALTPLERDFFLWLVQRARAGSKELEKICDEHLDSLRQESLNLGKQLPPDRVLDEGHLAVFYSHYHYSAVRLFTSLGKGKSMEEVQEHFLLSRARAKKILDFLLATGLCRQEGELFSMAVSRTVVGRDSPHLARHLTNWRLLALQNAEFLSQEEVMISSPVSLSRKDFQWASERIAELVREISERVRESPAELVACWNLDWLELKSRN